MASGPTEPPAFSFRRAFAWTEIFRCFQVALDPRKLLTAAAGILVMSLGWYALSTLFYYDRPDEKEAHYSEAALIQKRVGDTKADGKTPYTADEYKALGHQEYEQDLREWRVMHDLAGPDGQLRTLPWYEYRGQNPFTIVTRMLGGSSPEIADTLARFVSGTIPVLVEPLRKMLLPIVKLADPDATFVTRLYLLLALVWSIATWAFFGGIISRIAAVQFSGKERVTLRQAAEFVAKRYVSYLLSPLVPLGVIAVIVVCMAIYGLVAMIPGLGDIVLYGLGMPLVLIGGVAIAVLLVGLIGYPLMFTTISTEGTDTFDAVSRAYNYVFQAPWSFLWYSLVAVLYGALVTLFVVFMGSLAVYMGKWAVSQAPFSERLGREPDFLFIYSPESFGWRQLLLEGSPIEQREAVVPSETGRPIVSYTDADPEAAKAYREGIWGVEKAAAAMVSFWMVLVFLLVIGFSYSYFWSASTMIYLLMRKKVDETELDEVYLADESLIPPASATSTGPGAAPTAPSNTVSLPTVAPASPPAPVATSTPTTTTTTAASPPPPPVTTTTAVSPPPPVTTSVVSTPAPPPVSAIPNEPPPTKPDDGMNGSTK